MQQPCFMHKVAIHASKHSFFPIEESENIQFFASQCQRLIRNKSDGGTSKATTRGIPGATQI